MKWNHSWLMRISTPFKKRMSLKRISRWFHISDIRGDSLDINWWKWIAIHLMDYVLMINTYSYWIQDMEIMDIWLVSMFWNTLSRYSRMKSIEDRRRKNSWNNHLIVIAIWIYRSLNNWMWIELGIKLVWITHFKQKMNSSNKRIYLEWMK